MKDQLTNKIIWCDRILRPLSIVTFYFYKLVLAPLVVTILQRASGCKIDYFIRQGLSRTNDSFNFIFSDLDLGLIANSTHFEIIRALYEKMKSVLIFLGELEIYSSEEIKDLKNADAKVFELYLKLRKLRQINWIKHRLLHEPERKKYHRFKDLRKMYLLMNEIGLSNSRETLGYFYKYLFEFLSIKIENDSTAEFNQYVICCSYISQNIIIKTDSKNELLFVLACLPTYSRGVNSVDEVVLEMREKNFAIKDLFLKLNQIELQISRAYIRGARKKEIWFQSWLALLEQGDCSSFDNSNLEIKN